MESPPPPHALVIPFPAQGHVMPLMRLSHRLIDAGFRITFVNTHFIHARVVMAAEAKGAHHAHPNMRMAAIPDGLPADHDRKNVGELSDSFLRTMPGSLEKLISEINEEAGNSGGKIACLIADGFVTRALKVAAKMGIRPVAVWPSSVEFWKLNFRIPKLLEDGVIDANGFPTGDERTNAIKHSPVFPAMPVTELAWLSMPDRISQQGIFRLLSECGLALQFAHSLLCNSCSDIEQTACELSPQIKTIGPLFAAGSFRQSEGSFWQEDTECLGWLDRHPPNSVIYVAFGSFTIFEKRQFQELALGLELCNRSFLWVVRPGLIDPSSVAAKDPFPEGFESRVGDRGQIVGWCPQQKVLAHPSIACFVSHCGWNSTMEGLSSGVPFLCWPYFGDQQLNLAYICDVWKVGLALEKDGDGIVSRTEIVGKIQTLVCDAGIKARSANLKGTVTESVAEGGSSFKNFNAFVEAMKIPISRNPNHELK